MAIDPDAIAKFLDNEPRQPPPFKGASEAQLRAWIKQVSGCEVQDAALPLRKYQLEGLASALWLQQSFLFYGVRMGKTKIALTWAEHLRRGKLTHGKGLVIAHAPVTLPVWEGEARKHSSLDVRAVGAGPGMSDRLVDALESDCDMVVMSWSGMQELLSVKKLSRKKVPKLYPDHELIRMVGEHFTHAVIDETHLCQDYTSLRFNLAVDLLSNCRWRLGLTGTPMGRNPFSLWAQAFLIDAGETFGRNYIFFEQAFGKRTYNHFSRNKTEYVFDKKGKSEAFHRRLSAISLAYELSEVQEVNVLPAVVELEMTPEQRKAYNEVVDKFVKLNPLQSVEVRSTFVRMRQIASGYLPFVGPEGEEHVMRFKGAPKIEWLRTFLEECPRDVQGVIFHEFTPSGELLCKLLTELKISHSWLYGGESNAEKLAAITAFQSGKAQFLVANHATGGTGIDLPMADYLCFYESPVSPITRTQAAGRPLARGSRALMMDDLVCSPVESKILGFIAEGRDMMDELVHSRGKLARGLRA